MPRKTRIDAPGALQHIIVRGIERKKIFRDDSDRVKILKRLGVILSDTERGREEGSGLRLTFLLVRVQNKNAAEISTSWLIKT